MNATVDPDEAATRLPVGLRPHVTSVGTVVGCCLLDIADLRPAWMPACLGVKQRAVAHRVSVEWDDVDGGTVVGVWVPGRTTDSRLAIALGGRWFPGVHRPAALEVHATHERIAWRAADGGEIFIDVAATPSSGEVCDVVAGTCLSAAIGLSAGHRGQIEAARMVPDAPTARAVDVERLASRFIEGFRSAQPAPSYLMENVAVTWSPTAGPRTGAPVAA